MRAYRTLLVGIAICIVTRVQAASNSAAEIAHHIQQLIQHGNLVEAGSQLREALKQFPAQAGFYDLLGVVEAQRGGYRAAESSFTKAIELDPRLTGAYLNLGHLYQDNTANDREAQRKALETYNRLLRFDPNNVEANYQSAVLLERRGSFQASLERLSRLPPDGQDRAQTLAVRCADYAGLGDGAEAGSVAGSLLSRPELAEADILMILTTLEAHRRDALEMRLFEGLAARRLASPDILAKLALLYQRQGRLERAREALEKVAAAEPASVPILLRLARIANDQQDRKGALGYLAHARDLEPTNAAVHFFFGIVAVEENLIQEAYGSLKRAVSLDPKNPYYNYALGAVAVEREDPRESIVYFKRYCESKPQDPRGRLALGEAYFYNRDYESARKELAGVARDRRTAAGAHFYLGRIANQEGRLADAVQELEMALKANPEYAGAYAELGHVRLSGKEYGLAGEALSRALKIDPDSYVANLNLMILYQRAKDPRADAQARRFEEVKRKRSETAKEFLRTIEVRP